MFKKIEDELTPDRVKTVDTGAADVDKHILKVVGLLGKDWGTALDRNVVENEIGGYYISVLYSGRAGQGQARQGSTESCDVGGYLEDTLLGVFVTQKLMDRCSE